MFVRTTLVALVLASPAWADPEYPAGLFERSPLNDTPPAASRQGLVPPDKRKTRPGSEPVAAATTIVSGVIHGRNHAERIVHRPLEKRPIQVSRSPARAKPPTLKADDARLEFGHERSDRGCAHALCNALHRGCARYLFLVSRGGNRSKLAPTSD
jgi:hypothetical protein